mmetsp:Transcript_14729/g.45548  ORF Transcript_14729/g.45548 Transcript_14729/m.45548 type:complete len:145 (+) Transcript_14729:697-1131(+)
MALHVACASGLLNDLIFWLDRGAIIDGHNEDGRTPLTVACMNRRVDAATLLLDRGADIERADEDGRTPLYTSCWQGQIKMVRLLLARGADVEQGDLDGRSPFFCILPGRARRSGCSMSQPWSSGRSGAAGRSYAADHRVLERSL